VEFVGGGESNEEERVPESGAVEIFCSKDGDVDYWGGEFECGVVIDEFESEIRRFFRRLPMAFLFCTRFEGYDA
jgi:hypothetical protein